MLENLETVTLDRWRGRSQLHGELGVGGPR